jgi:hypothetical protein
MSKKKITIQKLKTRFEDYNQDFDEFVKQLGKLSLPESDIATIPIPMIEIHQLTKLLEQKYKELPTHFFIYILNYPPNN